MCQTATPTLGRWTTCTTTTQNFKTLPFPLTLVLDLQITTLLVACPPASRVCVLQGSAVSSAHPGRQSTWYQHQSSFLDQLYFSSLPITFLKRETTICTQGPSRQPTHPLPHHPLRLPGRQNHVWTHRRPWRNCLCPACSYPLCSHR